LHLIYDTESDGFLEEATCIHCIVIKDKNTKEIFTFDSSRNNIEEGLSILENANELICHNQISHDIPLIKKLYPTWRGTGLVLDTMLLSQLLNQERAGGHSLAAAGERYGRLKPEHEDWAQFSPEMLHRCSEDVEINTLLYEELMQEAYEDVRGLEYHKVFL